MKGRQKVTANWVKRKSRAVFWGQGRKWSCVTKCSTPSWYAERMLSATFIAPPLRPERCFKRRAFPTKDGSFSTLSTAFLTSAATSFDLSRLTAAPARTKRLQYSNYTQGTCISKSLGRVKKKTNLIAKKRDTNDRGGWKDRFIRWGSSSVRNESFHFFTEQQFTLQTGDLRLRKKGGKKVGKTCGTKFSRWTFEGMVIPSNISLWFSGKDHRT